MGIDPFLTGQAFDPQAVREMTLALQSVCNGLCVSTDDEETTRLVAEKIVELAGHGMRGATLHATAIKELVRKNTKASVVSAANDAAEKSYRVVGNTGHWAISEELRG